MITAWKNQHRPGYFGRRRDEKLRALDEHFGAGRWRLAHVVPAQGGPVTEERFKLQRKHQSFTFKDACKRFYEESYYRWLIQHPDDIDFICSFGECFDNEPTNVAAGLDYEKQDSWATHIQDIAIRNALARLGRVFRGPKTRLLQIRSADSNGARFGPGQVPFFNPQIICRPSLAPGWAKPGSVEDFWQSNKWVQTPVDDGVPELE